ncbi:hypothetical protein [Jiulongibacter sp. NS-SX5]|uniref:hypothetical protein n=1 Tax=Jiulongibacter sp. NS-SX5 TaxID=3463854 RepID=UPI0040595342
MSIASSAIGQHAHRVIVSIPEVVEMRLKENSSDRTEISFQNESSLEKGKEKIIAGTYQVRANTEWLVTVKPAQKNFILVKDGTESEMPTSILNIKESSSLDFQNLEEAGVKLVKGKPGSYSSKGNEFSFDLQAEPGLLYEPGLYETDIILTVTSL